MNRTISALLLAIILLSIHGVVRSDELLPVQLADAALLVNMRDAIVLPPTGMQELPEPAIVIMMLLGIGVIGYRTRRGEPFS